MKKPVRVAATAGSLSVDRRVDLNKVNMVTASAAITECTIYDMGTSSLGAEKVSNGTFSAVPSTEWTLNAGWSHDTTNLRIEHASGTGTAEQNVSAVAGEFYKVSFVIAKNAAGDALAGSLSNVKVGNTSLTSTFNAAATYTEYVKAANTNNLIFTPSNDFNGSIDSVTVKKMGDADNILFDGKNELTSASNDMVDLNVTAEHGLFVVLVGAGSYVYLYTE